MTNSFELIDVLNQTVTTDDGVQKAATPFETVDATGESTLETHATDHSEHHAHHEHESVMKHKFVGRSREREEILKTHSSRPPVEPPAEVLKWTEVLGLDSNTFTAADVHRAWRKQISSPDVHPDLGGELETAILLNTAKDSLTKWLDSFAPKLGKQFLHLK